jgi:hypothetical protein
MIQNDKHNRGSPQALNIRLERDSATAIRVISLRNWIFHNTDRLLLRL